MAITKIGTPELFDFSATNTALQLPTGDTASRPSAPSAGEWRFNTDEKYVEYWDGGSPGAWRQIDTDAPTFDFFNVREYTGNAANAFPNSSSQTVSTDFPFDLSITKAIDGPLRGWNVCDTLRNDTDNGTGFTPNGGTWDASGTNYIYMAWA